MKEHLRRYGAAWLLVAGTFIAPLVVYGHLPELVPTHWNAEGRIDNLEPRFIGVFLMPMFALGVVAAMAFGERLAPAAPDRPVALRYWPVLVTLVAATIFYLVLVQLRAALGHPVDMPGHALGIVGVVLMVTGNYLGKVTRNRMYGLRTPWTLASDHVWERTHRIGGPLFVAAGASFVVAALLPRPGGRAPLVVALAALLFIWPLAYSWWIARAERKETPR